MSTKMVEFNAIADELSEERYCNEHYTITFFDPSWAFASEMSPVKRIAISLGDYCINQEDLELQVLLVRSRRDRIKRVEFKLKSIIKKESIASFHKMTEKGQCGFILASFSDQILLKNTIFEYKMALSSSKNVDYTNSSLDIGSYYTNYFCGISNLKCNRLIFDKQTNEAVMYFIAYQGF